MTLYRREGSIKMKPKYFAQRKQKILRDLFRNEQDVCVFYMHTTAVGLCERKCDGEALAGGNSILNKYRSIHN